MTRKVAMEQAMNQRLRNTWAAVSELTLDRPTVFREVQAAAGLSSMSVAAYHLDKLAKLGYITWEPGYKLRTIRALVPLGSYTESDIHHKPKEHTT